MGRFDLRLGLRPRAPSAVPSSSPASSPASSSAAVVIVIVVAVAVAASARRPRAHGRARGAPVTGGRVARMGAGRGRARASRASSTSTLVSFRSTIGLISGGGLGPTAARRRPTRRAGPLISGGETPVELSVALRASGTLRAPRATCPASSALVPGVGRLRLGLRLRLRVGGHRLVPALVPPAVPASHASPSSSSAIIASQSSCTTRWKTAGSAHAPREPDVPTDAAACVRALLAALSLAALSLASRQQRLERVPRARPMRIGRRCSAAPLRRGRGQGQGRGQGLVLDGAARRLCQLGKRGGLGWMSRRETYRQRAACSLCPPQRHAWLPPPSVPPPSPPLFLLLLILIVILRLHLRGGRRVMALLSTR